MNIDEGSFQFLRHEKIGGKKYIVHFLKKEDYIRISIDENNHSYIDKLIFEDFQKEHNIQSKINLEELMSSLFNLKFPKLKKNQEAFIYDFVIDFNKEIISLHFLLKKEINKIDFKECTIVENYYFSNNCFNSNDLNNIKKEEKNTIDIMNNQIINNNFNIDEKGDNYQSKNINFLNKKRGNENEFSIFNINNESNEQINVIDLNKNDNYNKGYNQHIIDILGYKIKFPYEAYKEQIKFMTKILLCLNSDSNLNNRNALLESPHNTGKTLSLLCSIFTWNENLENPKKIIYCTKTLTQINNIIHEINKIKYLYNINYSLLSPREKFCLKINIQKNINLTSYWDESEEENTNNKEEKRKSHYYNYYSEEEGKSIINNKNELKIEKEDNILKSCKNCEYYKIINNLMYNNYDIEDLKIYAKNNEFCPYYYMKNKLENSNIIFVPYSYIFNDYFLSNIQLEKLIKDSIIVMDESHNILKICEDLNTVSLEYSDIIKCIEEIKANYKLNILEEKKMNDYIKYMKIIIEKILDYLSFLKESLLELYEQKIINQKYKIDDNILSNILGITAFDDTINKMDYYLIFLENNNLENIFLKKIKIFISFFSSIKSEGIDSYIFSFLILSKNYYIIKDKNFKIKINCLEIGNKFRNFLSKKPYRIIMTSGNLCPFHLFESDLNHIFYIKFSGNHIIGKNKLIFKFITNYKLIENPNKKYPFYFASNISESDLNKQYKILGYLLLDLSKITPGGILMFFSSLKYLNNCINIWKEEEIYDKIDNIKKLTIDTRKHKLKQYMIEERNNINNNYNIENNKSYESYTNPLTLYKKSIDEENGGIIISTINGKIGQNISFKGKYGRMVINVGIPFINIKSNEKNSLKKNYYYKIGKIFNEWLKDDALFKINQTCGRVIRDKNDFGVILNIDIRNEEFKNYFSEWLKSANPKPEDYVYDTNENNNIRNNEFIKEIEKFYRIINA